MTPNDPELLRYYNDRAPEYEQIYYRDVPQRQMELADETKRLALLVKSCSVLDLACGTGYWLEKMADSARGITATDINAAMIQQAKAKSFACPVDFVQADLHELPFAEHVFDRVTLGFWLSHHSRRHYADLFGVLRAHLREAGSTWMIDNNPPAEGLTHNSIGVDKHGNNLIKRRLDSGDEYVIIKNYFDRDQLEALLGSEFHIERLTYGVYYWSAVVRNR